MPPYTYLPLLPGFIRLLRLKPHENAQAPIQCELFHYPLTSDRKGTHLYEALSYCWGPPDKTQRAFTETGSLHITANLHAALARLRDPFLERVIWADAICINQDDADEKGRQVQLMAEIYARASGVVVWLEEVTGHDQLDRDAQADSHRAHQAIGLAASEERSTTSANEDDGKTVVQLLNRNWFNRIWILQEVAASRHVLIMCRSTEMDGHAFCQGLGGMDLSSLDQTTQTRVRSAIYLIKSATLRPKHTLRTRGAFSLNIRSLGELIDLYHTQNATDRRDKIYALLGMSTDTYPGLKPDYRISWKDLFSRLVRTFVPEAASVSTWNSSETALIQTRGCALGTVSSVEPGSPWDDADIVNVIGVQDVPGHLRSGWIGRWTVRAAAKRARTGDVICLLQGACRPTLIRVYDDYCVIIAIVVVDQTPAEKSEILPRFPHRVGTEIIHESRRLSLDRLGRREREFLLDGRGQEEHGGDESGVGAKMGPGRIDGEFDAEPRNEVREGNNTRIETKAHNYPSQFASGIQSEVNFLLVWDWEASHGAEAELDGFLQERAIDYAGPSRGVRLKEVGLLYSKMGYYNDAISRFDSAIQVFKKTSQIDCAEALSVMDHLVWCCSKRNGHRDDKRIEALQKMADVAVCRKSYDTTEASIVKLASFHDTNALEILLDTPEHHVKITENILIAVASNEECGYQMMSLLLDHGDDIIITENVLKAAVENQEMAWSVVALLFERKEDQIDVTESLIWTAARQGEKAEELGDVLNTLRVLFSWKGCNTALSRKGAAELFVLKPFLRESNDLDHIYALLLGKRSDPITITKDTVEVIGGSCGGDCIHADATCIEHYRWNMYAIARCRDAVLGMLLDWEGGQIVIADDALVAFAEGSRYLEEIWKGDPEMY